MERSNRLDEPVFVSALLFLRCSTRLGEYEKFYVPCALNFATKAVKKPELKKLWVYLLQAIIWCMYCLVLFPEQCCYFLGVKQKIVTLN